jgi:tryptophan 7-halogenase
LGLTETELVRECDAVFKQGSSFVGWLDGSAGDRYLHPFTLPHGHGEADLVAGWLETDAAQPFAESVCPQPMVCQAGLAPKQVGTPEFAGVTNYGYHFDAVKLGLLLRRHATEKLGVRHLAATVERVRSHESGDIAALVTRECGEIEGDLFIDCSGLASLLLGKHFGVPLHSVQGVLFNDTALAVQVPHATESAPIACTTIATAHAEGWTWDIALPARRGVGLVYSSSHTSDDAAQAALRAYLERSGAPTRDVSPRRISFQPGYREQFWQRNCVAVGLAAGFIEPLEASALALVELSAAALRDDFPATRADMDLVAKRFNQSFSYRWARIIDFLKLHYVLSRREDAEYWRAHRDAQSIPDSLRESLQLWKHRAPARFDLDRHDEIFPVASYQYVLYGMRCLPRLRPVSPARLAQAQACMRDAERTGRRLAGGLPRHRDLIDHFRTHGIPHA